MDWRAWTTVGVALGTLAVPVTASAQRVVYINTGAETLTNAAGQDPTVNSYNTMGFTPGPISGWPALTENQKLELLYWLKEGSVEFDVIYTFERPMMGSYDMIVMGSDVDNAALFPGLGCSAAIGLADCNDANAENISFLFWGCMSAGDQADMHKTAFRIYSALGFGWGLENLAVTGQIMGGYSGTALHFGNTCQPISGMQLCVGQHVGCADPTQNSTADLLARIGPRIDDGPPFVTITEPADLAIVPTDFTVGASVGDLYGGLDVTLELVEVGQVVVDDFPPYGWDLENVPAGVWTLKVTATDADLNVVSQQVTVCVDLDTCDGLATGTGTGGSTGGDTGAGTTGDGGNADSSTGAAADSTGDGTPDPPPSLTTGMPPVDPPPLTGEDAETGCQCRADANGRAPAGLGLLALSLLGLRRRRD